MRERSRIAKLRELSGLTVIEASKQSGVSKNTIRSWENFQSGTSENIEALLTVYFRALDPEKNKEMMK